MPTMLDVAKHAGVALSTVSYAINGTRSISEPTRRRVQLAMEELGYHPNLLARSLITKRTRIIALLFPSIMNGGLNDTQAEFVASAASVTSERRYGLLLWTSSPDELNIQRLAQGGLIEGLILMEVKLHDEHVEMLHGGAHPFALIGHCADNTGIAYVDYDFVAALHLAVNHLAGLRHRSIAFLNLQRPLVDAGVGPALRSLEGFNAATKAQRIRALALCGAPVAKGGAELVKGLLAESPEVTALIVFDEGILAAVTQTAYQLGLRIPEDLSVVTIMSRNSAERMTPPMTNLEVPASEMGRMGVEMLIDQLEHPAQPVRQILLPPILRIAAEHRYTKALKAEGILRAGVLAAAQTPHLPRFTWIAAALAAGLRREGGLNQR